MKNLRRTLSVLVFISIVLVTSLQLNTIFLRKSQQRPWDMGNKIGGYFNETEHYRMMFFGTSHTYCAFQPLTIYNDLGAKSYVLASQKQPLSATYYYMQQVIARQKDVPNIFVLDIYSLIANMGEDSTIVHSYTDYFPMSWTKLKMIAFAVPQKYKAEAFFPLIMYHSRWNELKEEDFTLKPKDFHDYLKGYVLLKGQSKEFKQKKEMNEDTKQALLHADAAFLQEQFKLLQKIHQLCLQHNINLLLVKTPIYDAAPYEHNIELVKEFAQRENIPFTDYNQYRQQMQLSSEDFYDFYHLNVQGAEKFNRFFIQDMIAHNIYFDTSHLDPLWQKNLSTFLINAK